MKIINIEHRIIQENEFAIILLNNIYILFNKFFSLFSVPFFRKGYILFLGGFFIGLFILKINLFN
jgi:hypothetical protein